jgi:hypothetical protein
MTKKKVKKLAPVAPEYIVQRDDAFRALVERNVKTINDVFTEDPNKILVSVQIEEDQIDHLAQGLTGRSRRLIPLPLFAELIRKLNS